MQNILEHGLAFLLYRTKIFLVDPQGEKLYIQFQDVAFRIPYDEFRLSVSAARFFASCGYLKSRCIGACALLDEDFEVKNKTPYMVFARKWRPQTFAEVVGQQAISDALRNAIATNRIANAYLFCGPRGIGKTSMARILAKALNCKKGMKPEPCGKCHHCKQITAGSDMDVIEIDGASYTKIDDVRELQEGIGRSAYAARKKVYIIDEVHMLSQSAFNALLKTIEETRRLCVCHHRT